MTLGSCNGSGEVDVANSTAEEENKVQGPTSSQLANSNKNLTQSLSGTPVSL